MQTDADSPVAPRGGKRADGLVGLIVRYLAVAGGVAWCSWAAAAALLRSDWLPDALVTVAGALELAGTLAPAFALYVVFPRLRACGLAPDLRPARGRDPRGGFVRYCMGAAPSVRSWVAFALFCAWRYAMFRMAFGFPETPLAALENFAVGLPALLVGGGLEELGWRGCLQPALTELFGERFRKASPAWVAPVLAAVATGAIWGFWHVPLLFVPGSFQQRAGILAVIAAGIVLSCSFGALGRRTGSLPLCVLSHAWYNAMLVGIPAASPAAVALFALEAALGCLALALPSGTRNPQGRG